MMELTICDTKRIQAWGEFRVTVMLRASPGSVSAQGYKTRLSYLK